MSHEIQKPTDIEVPSTSLFAKLPLIGGVLAVAGLGATLGTAMGGERARAMFSYLWAFESVLALALGAFGWLVVDITTRSQWSIVLRRIAETIQATLPIFFVLWLPIALLGMHDLYPWSHETDAILERKRWFLTDGAWWTRAIIYFVLWVVLSQFFYRSSVKMDALGDNTTERDRLVRRTWKFAAPSILIYALTQSFAAIDWVMSLQPHWYSTMFGVYFFASSILVFYAVTTLIALAMQRGGMLKTAITPEHYQDLGKLVFGFTIFWAYIAFSQFVLIWYASIPEETEFYMVRMQGGWGAVSYALPVLHFFVPFLFLLSRHVKRARWPLALGAVWMVLMHLLDMYWIILPNFGLHGEGHHEAHLAFSWLDGAALVGMVGAFLAAFGFLLKRQKVVAVNDPRLGESLAHENY